ncbi:hypothetical protein ZIOFF_035592 [Zingiber officinale]|uniref:XPG-I domain-containing protein n=1 Tax=Zingiber officinale TaxID=94328 RepID=A0A8J5GCR7_ZINOF|nr:hypothetical protein ZIOFF_035592 [Zingiber officinale]
MPELPELELLRLSSPVSSLLLLSSPETTEVCSAKTNQDGGYARVGGGRGRWYHWATRQASHLGDRGKGIDFREAVRSGGMSSTHSSVRSVVTAMATLLGLEREFSDSIFGMSVVFATLVIYSKREDATNDLNTTIEVIAFAYICCLQTGDLEGIEKYRKKTVKHEVSMQCAALYKSDKVFVVASEDMDTLTFGALRFLRHLMDPILEELRLTIDQFIDLSILSDVIIVIALKYDNACVVEYGASATTIPCLCYLDLI